jgi:predicted esterase
MSQQADQPEDYAALYRRAFAEFGTIALWSSRPVPEPTPADALAITRALRTHGTMDGRRLAERIEALCRAHQ